MSIPEGLPLVSFNHPRRKFIKINVNTLIKAHFSVRVHTTYWLKSAKATLPFGIIYSSATPIFS